MDKDGPCRNHTKEIRIMEIQIEEHREEEFMKLVASLNRKARRLNVEPLSCHFVEKRNSSKTIHFENGEKEEIPVTVNVYEVSEIEIFESGWRVVASIVSIEGEDNFTTLFPNSKLDLTPYRSRPHHCDHCNTQRSRNITYVVENKDGRVMQVGRSCMAEVLEGGSLMSLEFRSEVFRIFQELREGGDDFFGGGSKTQKVVRVIGAIAAAEKIFTICGGWVNNQWSDDWERYLVVQGTHRIARDVMTNSNPNTVLNDAAHSCKAYAKLTPALFFEESRSTEYEDRAQSIVDEIQAIDENELDEFGSLLKYVTSFRSVPVSMGAVAAYAGQFLRKRKEDQEKAAQAAKMVHVGTVGGKEVFEVEFVRTSGFNSNFGYTFIHTFRDTDGNQLIWRTGKEIEVPNGFFKIQAKVKAHSEYRGVRQTEINYVKILD